jgi:hypothetical protein
MKFILGIDQHGQHYDNLGKHPRKELLERLYAKSAEKMYIDKSDGSIKHVGYIIAGLWITLYYIEAWEKDI